MRSQRTPLLEDITITLQLERIKELPSGKVTPDGGPKSYRPLPISDSEKRLPLRDTEFLREQIVEDPCGKKSLQARHDLGIFADEHSGRGAPY